MTILTRQEFVDLADSTLMIDNKKAVEPRERLSLEKVHPSSQRAVVNQECGTSSVVPPEELRFRSKPNDGDLDVKNLKYT